VYPCRIGPRSGASDTMMETQIWSFLILYYGFIKNICSIFYRRSIRPTIILGLHRKVNCDIRQLRTRVKLTQTPNACRTTRFAPWQQNPETARRHPRAIRYRAPFRAAGPIIPVMGLVQLNRPDTTSALPRSISRTTDTAARVAPSVFLPRVAAPCTKPRRGATSNPLRRCGASQAHMSGPPTLSRRAAPPPGRAQRRHPAARCASTWARRDRPRDRPTEPSATSGDMHSSHWRPAHRSRCRPPSPAALPGTARGHPCRRRR